VCNEPSVATVCDSYIGEIITLVRRTRCCCAFIADPWLEFEQIPDERYYAGEGADPFSTTATSSTSGKDHRAYEMERDCLRRAPPGRSADSRCWIDFACGNGGLVRTCGSMTALTPSATRRAQSPLVSPT
jgi:hypothetical protein